MGVKSRVGLCALSLMAVNIAIARILIKFPGQWSWWPLWNGGLPFETSYLPFSHWVVALFSFFTGLSAARSFHIVTAGFYVLGRVALF